MESDELQAASDSHKSLAEFRTHVDRGILRRGPGPEEALPLQHTGGIEEVVGEKEQRQPIEDIDETKDRCQELEGMEPLQLFIAKRGKHAVELYIYNLF